MIPASVDPCLATLRNSSPACPSSNSPTVTYPWQSATRNENVFESRFFGSLRRTGFSTVITCSTSRSATSAGVPAVSFFWVASGWATLQLSR